jgi:hypothetical protein
MSRKSLFAIVTLSLLGYAAASGAAEVSRAQPPDICTAQPTEDATGYYAGCAYYPGYGWAKKPVQHGSAPGVTG